MSGSFASRRVLVAVAVAALVVSYGTAAYADAQKCKAAIVKAGAAFVQAKAKALVKCEEAMVKGKLAAGDCHGDPKAAPAIAKAATKLRASIHKACGGKDKACATGDDDTLASIGWDIGVCPNFENGACGDLIEDCADVATCVQCIGEAATDRAVGVSYDAFVASNPKTEKELNKCQVAIGKATAAFFVARSKALAKCWKAVNANKATNPCPVPGDGKAAAAIAKAETKKRAAICKACGGADKLCNGVGDLTPTAIGFVAQCPNATTPGGEVCDGAVATLADLVDCVDCVNAYAADCSDRSAVPAFVSPYPAVCNGVGGPTPTATVAETPTPTETVTPTATATETPTPTETATETASPTPTETATETASPTPTETATETASPTPTETATTSPSPTETATATTTLTPTPTETPTETASPTETPTPSVTATETPTPTDTPTETATATATESPTPTASETPTPTATATASCTDSSDVEIAFAPSIGDYWRLIVGSSGGSGTNNDRQRVKNTSGRTVCRVKLCLGNTGTTPTGAVTVELRSDDGGSGAGTTLYGASEAYDVGALTSELAPNGGACGNSPNGQVVEFAFASPVSVPGNDFWLVLRESSPLSDDIRWGSNLSDTNYPNGCMGDCADYSGFQGVSQLADDFYFVLGTQ